MKSKIIVALDFDTQEETFRLVDLLGDSISWYKVGPVLFTRYGPPLIEGLKKRNKKVFLDLKLHDIPAVVEKTISQMKHLGVEMTTLHCLGGKEMLERALRASEKSRLIILGVTLLTSHDETYLKKIGISDAPSCWVLRLLDLALQARMQGIVCSPSEIIFVKEKCPSLIVVTPGIRSSRVGAVNNDDQRRSASPQEAFSHGADYIVIGRPITESKDPLRALEDLCHT